MNLRRTCEALILTAVAELGDILLIALFPFLILRDLHHWKSNVCFRLGEIVMVPHVSRFQEDRPPVHQTFQIPSRFPWNHNLTNGLTLDLSEETLAGLWLDCFYLQYSQRCYPLLSPPPPLLREQC